PRASVDIYARLYSADGTPVGNEFLVNTSNNTCANPTAAPTSTGGFMVSWGERDGAVRANGWDGFARPFTSAGVGSAVVRVNTQQLGDQLGPQISAQQGSLLVVWTSLGQDGSLEGVYGQVLLEDGSTAGGEFRVNTKTYKKQMHPAI